MQIDLSGRSTTGKVTPGCPGAKHGGAWTHGLGVWTRRDGDEETAGTAMRYRAGATGPNGHLPEPGERRAARYLAVRSGSPSTIRNFSGCNAARVNSCAGAPMQRSVLRCGGGFQRITHTKRHRHEGVEYSSHNLFEKPWCANRTNAQQQITVIASTLIRFAVARSQVRGQCSFAAV